MKVYRMTTDNRERNVKEELELHTFEQLKESFKPEEELTEELEKFQKAADIDDLRDFLKEQAAGMAQPYEFEEVEVEDLEEMNRSNDWLSAYDMHGFND